MLSTVAAQEHMFLQRLVKAADIARDLDQKIG